MAFLPTESFAVPQAIADTSTTQLLPLGTIVRAYDPVTYGGAEFIYLKGVASTAVGSAVVYDNVWQTTLTVAASRGPVAISMSANVASQYGWYQIGGLAVGKVATVASGAALQTSATAGQLDDTITAGQFIDGAVTKTADAAGVAVVALSRPCCNGR